MCHPTHFSALVVLIYYVVRDHVTGSISGEILGNGSSFL
jgi:hypothetical protein